MIGGALSTTISLEDLERICKFIKNASVLRVCGVHRQCRRASLRLLMTSPAWCDHLGKIIVMPATIVAPCHHLGSIELHCEAMIKILSAVESLWGL